MKKYPFLFYVEIHIRELLPTPVPPTTAKFGFLLLLSALRTLFGTPPQKS